MSVVSKVSKKNDGLRDADDLPDIRKVNKNEACEFFSVHKATIDTWIRNGCPVLQRGGQGVPWVIDLYEMAKWRFSPKDEIEEIARNPESMDPKERLEWYRGNMQRRKDALEANEVVSADEAKTVMSELLKTMALTLDTLVENVDRQVKLKADQAKQIESVIDELRRALHKKLKTQIIERKDT